jgi:hypothetical protein
MRSPGSAIEALVTGLVDYAGLFPPAAHSMADAVAECETHLESPERWMLGRFVVPASRLEELAARRADAHADAGTPWRVSALLSEDHARELDAIARIGAMHGGTLTVDTLEARCVTPSQVVRLAALVSPNQRLFIEISAEADQDSLLSAMADKGACAKLRTGGVQPSDIPGSHAVARFIAGCAATRVPFKVTAGLHQPVAGLRPLTYESDGPVARMHGFVNVFLGAAFAWIGMEEYRLVELLAEEDPQSFAFDARGARWRDLELSTAQISYSRSMLATAFGSCSFMEPLEGLRRHGYL